MPIAGASWRAVSRSFGFLNVPLSATIQKRVCLNEPRGFRGSNFLLLNLILSHDFAAARNRKPLKPDRQGVSVLHTCIAASAAPPRAGMQIAKSCDDPEEPRIYQQHPPDCFPRTKHQVTSGLQQQGSGQHGGSVPISSRVDKITQNKTAVDQNLKWWIHPATHFSSKAPNFAVTSPRFPLRMHFN